jgi:hypothetical protein
MTPKTQTATDSTTYIIVKFSICVNFICLLSVASLAVHSFSLPTTDIFGTF